MDAKIDQLACVPIRCRKRTVAMLETEHGDENIEFWLTCMAKQLSRYAEKHVVVPLQKSSLEHGIEVELKRLWPDGSDEIQRWENEGGLCPQDLSVVKSDW